MNNPHERYSKHINHFDKLLKKSLKEGAKRKTIHIGALLHGNDGRTPCFQLQGLARIDSKIGKDKKQAENFLFEFKEIEDAIGKFDYWNAMLESNKHWRFPKVVGDYFTNMAYLNLGILEDRMIRQGWLKREFDGLVYSDEALKNFNLALKKLDYFGSEKEKKKITKLLRDEATEIHEKVKSSEIDLNQIELGIHEFRRKIRWLGIYSSALLGKVVLDNETGDKALSHFINKEKSALKYNKLPINPKQRDPVFFLKGGFYAVSELIGIIGDIKDRGLVTGEVLQIGKLFGLKESLIKKHLGSEYYPYPKVVESAHKVIKQYIFKENILLHIAEHFDKQLK